MREDIKYGFGRFVITRACVTRLNSLPSEKELGYNKTHFDSIVNQVQRDVDDRPKDYYLRRKDVKDCIHVYV